MSIADTESEVSRFENEIDQEIDNDTSLEEFIVNDQNSRNEEFQADQDFDIDSMETDFIL